MRNTLIFLVLLAVAAGVAFQVLKDAKDNQPTAEFAAAGTIPADGSAEVLQASPDGDYLLHTNTARKSVDVIDITDPAQAGRVGRINLPGNPTGVAISPDGKWALATLYLASAENGKAAPHPRLPGGLAIIDLQDHALPRLAEIIGIGHQPSGVVAASSGTDLVAVIAIENAPLIVNSKNLLENTPEGADISQPGQVQVVSFSPLRQDNYRVGTLDLSTARLAEAGLSNPDDAQPAFVALAPNLSQAAAALPYNNGIAVFDPYWLGTRRLFSTGERSPVAVTFSYDGSTVFSADGSTSPEGDIHSVTAWSAEGKFIWSDDSLPEVNNLAAKRFGTTDFAFALSQQGKLIAIYDVTAPTAPQLVQKIAVGVAPTGIALIPARGLAAVSNESGEILLYRRNQSAESSK